MTPILEVRDLTHIYSVGTPFEHTALDHVSFSVEKGEFLGIIGHTGSGKSTLIQHLNGLLKPTDGEVLLSGQNIWESKQVTRACRFRVGLVFQYPEYQLFEETVAKDVAFGPKNLGLSQEEIDSRVKEAVTMVGLDYDQIKDRSPFELSGGQKRRVAIAGVIAMGPEVLILDEPTAGLDPKAHKDILSMIEEVHRLTGNITILVSHNMADVARLSDKILVIDSGHLVVCGTPKEVFSQTEELEKVGLDLPPITRLTEELRKRGMKIEPTILSIDEAAGQIAEYLKARGNG